MKGFSKLYTEGVKDTEDESGKQYPKSRAVHKREGEFKGQEIQGLRLSLNSSLKI